MITNQRYYVMALVMLAVGVLALFNGFSRNIWWLSFLGALLVTVAIITIYLEVRRSDRE